jgi:DNA-binding XRE family transcriptional regulator
MKVETWKALPGAVGRYVVSDQGNVRTLRHTVIDRVGRRHPVTGRLLKPVINIDRKRNKPYRIRGVRIRFDDGRTRWRTVAVLMLEAFVGPRPYPKAVARHLNDESLDDRLENLDWGSPPDNGRDAVLNGHHPRRRGSSNGCAKLTEADVLEIQAAYAAGGVTQRELAEQYDVSTGTINHILTGRNWRHVQVPNLCGKGMLTATATSKED